jgi:AAA15 family ATPase/GTPase
MLCQFTFKNFKSYRDETVFDLQATSIKEFQESLLRNEKDIKSGSFLPVSVLYGPNAGGKSGVLEALNCLVSQVMGPIDYMNKNNILITQRYYKYAPFMYNESSSNEPTWFTVYFQEANYEFRYSLALLNGNVVSESLYKRNLNAKNPAKIFVRDGKTIEHGNTLKKIPLNNEINCKMPYFSFLAINFNNLLINTALNWFGKCLFINYANSATLSEIHLFPREKEQVISLLNDMGIPILNYETMHSILNEEEFYVIRQYGDQKFKLDFSYESRGTVKLFHLIPKIIIALREGRLLVVDELDASLHSKLLRYIIKLFTLKEYNINNGQLIFTSHDIATMKNDVFRRDEIWFAAKDKSGSSEIYSLYDIRTEDDTHVRPNSAFDKQYLEGRYGADPYLSEMTGLKWSE